MGMIARLIEPRRETVPMDRQMFSNMDLKQLILPLIVEAAGCVSAAASGGRSGSSDPGRDRSFLDFSFSTSPACRHRRAFSVTFDCPKVTKGHRGCRRLPPDPQARVWVGFGIV